MQVLDLLKNASELVYQNVRYLAGTPEAGGDFGVGAGGDISRNIDITAEKTIIDYLKENSFDCVILGEECGRVELEKNPKGFVIMDAIDGSTNAVKGIPFFCCSLAFSTNERLSSITDGVVTNLSTGDMYWASKGKGAFLNGKPISVQNRDRTYRVVGVNISGVKQDIMERLQPILENNHIRHFGANALEMAMFATGLMDVFLDLRGKIRVQDLAAGYLLIKEAGGLVLDADLKPLESDLSYTRLTLVAAADRQVLDEVWSQMK